jgi:RNA recognition motif-containing protein
MGKHSTRHGHKEMRTSKPSRNFRVSRSKSPYVPEAKIVGKGLSVKCTHDAIKNYFMNFGTVKNVWMKMDDERNFKGVCFVTLKSDEEVERVLAQTKHELNGKVFAVEKAHRVLPVRTPARKKHFSIFTKREFRFQISSDKMLKRFGSSENFIKNFLRDYDCKVEITNATHIRSASSLHVVSYEIEGEHAKLYDAQRFIQKNFGSISFRQTRE